MVETLGPQPAYQGPLENFIYKLDLGPHRWWRGEFFPENRSQPPTSFEKMDFVLVEVTADDISSLSGYQEGYYTSPFSPLEVIRRLGPPSWAGK